MRDRTFTDAQDLWAYYDELKLYHAARIRQHLELQAMWMAPVRTNDTGHTVYINNEPWTATRLSVNMVTAGELSFKGFSPRGVEGDEREENQRIAATERFLKAHYTETDYRLFTKRRNSYLREWAYYALVYGWHAGINLVLDGAPEGEDPIFTDLWSPLETYPDMQGGSEIIHVSKMRVCDIEYEFGAKGRKGRKKSPGYNFNPEGLKDSDLVEVIECWSDERHSVAALGPGGAAWLKKQTEHGLGHNPAWCNAIDGVPFRSATTTAGGTMLTTPNFDGGDWLEWHGQSPLVGYKTAYRVLTETANAVAQVMQKWAKGAEIVVQTPNNEIVTFEVGGGEPIQVPDGSKIVPIQPPKFPADDRAWMEIMMGDIEKASHSKAAYGILGPTEAAQAIQLLRMSSSYIIGPIIEQAEFMYEYSANCILKQMRGAKGKGGQYAGRPFGMRSTAYVTKSKKAARIVEFFDVTKMDLTVHVTASIKGAGVPEDQLARLMMLNQISNSPSPILSDFSLLDDYAEIPDPQGEIIRKFEQRLLNSPEVLAAAGPVPTLLNIADIIRSKGTPRARMIADLFEAQAQAAAKQLAGEAKQQPAPPAGPGGPPMGPGMPPGAIPLDGPPPDMMPMEGGMPPGAIPLDGPPMDMVPTLPPEIMQLLPPEITSNPQIMAELAALSPEQLIQILQELGILPPIGPGSPLMAGPGGPPPQPPPGMGPPMQAPGMPPMGAPPAGVPQPPTGPAPMRGMQMNMADRGY